MRWAVGLLTCWVLLGASLVAAKPLPDLSAQAPQGVLVVPIHGTIDLGLAPYVRRALAAHPDAAVVILDVDTFGGRVDAAVRIRDALLSAGRPSIAFVHRRAISAGALISLAAEHIVVTSGATMGAATPVQLEGGDAKPVEEKMVSYMRSEMRATAEARGRSGDIAEAMVDADFEVPGLDEKGKLLTLTTDTALSSGIADAQFETLDALLAALGLSEAPRLDVAPTWAEQVARVLTDPTVSGLLMGLGTLGLLIELTHPGLIIPGVIGAISLGLFLGGHWVVELAGWEELILLLLGVFLLAAELLILPGFGLAGIGGLLSLAAALTLALIGLPLGVSWELGLITDALSVVVISTFVAAVLLLVAMRFLPQRRFARGLVLQTTLDAVVTPPASALLGALGVASTDLRPAGKALIDGRLVDVVSQLHFVERGASVQVVEVEGARVVVLERTSQPTHATEQEI